MCRNSIEFSVVPALANLLLPSIYYWHSWHSWTNLVVVYTLSSNLIAAALAASIRIPYYIRYTPIPNSYGSNLNSHYFSEKLDRNPDWRIAMISYVLFQSVNYYHILVVQHSDTTLRLHLLELSKIVTLPMIIR